MIEVGLVTGYLIAWAMRKVRRAAAALDDDVDEALDAGLDRLHELVATKLGQDPALEKLQVEVTTAGNITARTQRRVDDALAEAAEADEAFAGALHVLIAELRQFSSGVQTTASGDRATAISGDVRIRAEHGSAAAVSMGDVTIGTSSQDPQGPGQSSG